MEKDLRQMMWDNAGIVRTADGLEEARAAIKRWREDLAGLRGGTSEAEIERRSLEIRLSLSEMVCRAAAEREESRGVHYRKDFPKQDDENWLKNICFQRVEGQLEMSCSRIGGGGRCV
jgi:succinate dehydrogenase/fumarate reductase flavoprotein subunit